MLQNFENFYKNFELQITDRLLPVSAKGLFKDIYRMYAAGSTNVVRYAAEITGRTDVLENGVRDWMRKKERWNEFMGNLCDEGIVLDNEIIKTYVDGVMLGGRSIEIYTSQVTWYRVSRPEKARSEI